MVAPCKGCPDRVLGCHTLCAKYHDYRRYKEREYGMRADYYDAQCPTIGHIRSAIKRQHAAKGGR